MRTKVRAPRAVPLDGAQRNNLTTPLYLTTMKVSLLVASNKYTGAAAAAEHCCRALMAAGVDSQLVFTGGNNLERRLRGFDWARPTLRKERGLGDLGHNLEVIREAAAAADLLICHLPHDHALAVHAKAYRTTPIVRNFRNSGHVRRDPYHRHLNRRLTAALAANSALEAALRSTLRREVPVGNFPVPLEERFRPGRDPLRWRERLGIPGEAPVAGMIGKVARGRGFDLFLQAAARLDESTHLIVIGHGEAQPELEALATRLGLTKRLHWTGYQDRELPAIYAAMNVVLFPAAGSDHGHRAISEAQGCGRPVVAADLPGVRDLVEDGVTGRVVPATSESMGEAMANLLDRPSDADAMGSAAAAATEARRFPMVGRALSNFLEEVLRQTSSTR
ncbi:MAG TPA: glycosyltransferase [Acidobacteria bacterium]|nr:glycosyltransferase [Acidobacteriota bacterium]